MLEKTSLVDKVVNVIKDKILEGEIEPGAQLIQNKLANELGISRTPVMHALEKLETEGVVRKDSRNGRRYVRNPSLDELITIFEIRLRIEPLAVKYAAEHIEENVVKDFKSKFGDALNERDNKRYRHLDNKLHTLFPKNCTNRDLKDLTVRSGILTRFLLKGLVRSPEDTYPEHIEILESLIQGDSLKAEKAMEKHIANSLSEIKKHQENKGNKVFEND